MINRIFQSRHGYWMIASLLVASLLLTSCSGVNQESAPPKAVDTQSISIMLPLHQNQAPPTEMLHIVEKALRAKMDMEWIPNDIYKDKLVNALETNSLKQVTYVNQSDYVLMKNAIRSEAFWEIGTYLEFYPNLKRLQKSVLAETSVEGKIYSLYTERQASRQGVILRKDWLDRLHLKEPATLDELYNVLKQFTYNDPDGNGVQDTIGLADRGDLIYGAFKTLGSYFGVPNNWSVMNNTFVPEFETPEYIDTMNFMKKLVNEKIVNRDMPVTSKQIQRYMLINGKAGGFIGSMSDAPRLLEELRKFEPKAELTVINSIRGPKGYGVWSIPSFSGVFLFSKKAIQTEEELRSILAFFDRSMGEEVVNLLQYGVPDKHYTVEAGEIVIPPEMKPLWDTEVLPLHSLVIPGDNNPNLLKVKQESKDPLTVKVEQLLEDNERMLVHDPAQKLSSPTYDAVGAELTQIINNATYSYILGLIDLPAFQNEIALWEKKGGAKVIEELGRAYQQSSK